MKFYDARSGLHSALKSLLPFNNSTPRRKLNYIILTAACGISLLSRLSPNHWLAIDQNTYSGLNTLIGECVHWIKKHGYPPNQAIPCLHPPRSVDSTSFQIGFQFVQVGSDDQTRTRLKQLDDAHLENVSGRFYPLLGINAYFAWLLSGYCWLYSNIALAFE